MRERKQRGGGGFLARQITGKQGKVRCRKKKGRKVGEGVKGARLSARAEANARCIVLHKRGAPLISLSSAPQP